MHPNCKLSECTTVAGTRSSRRLVFNMGVDVSTDEPIGSGLADVVLFGVESIKTLVF